MFLSKEWFDRAFTDTRTNNPIQVPGDIRDAAERICQAYGINGVCDPMYIANLIAMSLGRGDGKSHFFPEKSVTCSESNRVPEHG
jgi:hypothetical protein